jgi:hypothetical protein
MRKSTRRLLGFLLVAAGSLGAVGAYLKKKNRDERSGKPRARTNDVWARPGMKVTFRAELMPGREREERTFRVKELLPSGRVALHGTGGEHAAAEFEAVN